MMGVVSELLPGTSYELRVAAVNGAAIAGGIGFPSLTVTALTNSGKPLFAEKLDSVDLLVYCSNPVSAAPGWCHRL